MKIKWYTLQQQTGQISNHRGNYKIPWDKWKLKQNVPMQMGCGKTSAIVLITYIKKEESSQTNN